MRFMPGLALVLCAALAMSCAETKLVVRASPAAPAIDPWQQDPVPLFVDGERAGFDRIEMDLPYHGRMLVTTAPPATPAQFAGPSEPLLIDAVEQLPLPTPVTPWIFPFDFPVEALGRLVGLVRSEIEFEVPVARQPVPMDDVLPTGIQGIAERAHAQELVR